MKIEKYKTTSVRESFKWRDRKGSFYLVSDMGTGHLFFTLRMIWNHSMHCSVTDSVYNKYNFSSFYTLEYMLQAIRAIFPELVKREDLTNSQKDWISQKTLHVISVPKRLQHA